MDVAAVQVGLYFGAREQCVPSSYEPRSSDRGSFAFPGVGMRNPDVRVPAWFAIKRLGVTKQAFNYWRTAGKITPDRNGNYRWGDLLEVEAATRNNPNSRRGATLRRRSDWPALNVNSGGMPQAC